MILFEKKYQTFDTVFHHKMKHLEVRQKYSAARRIFNSLLDVSSGDETLHLILIYYMKIGRFTPILSVRILFKAVFIGSFLNLNLTFAICRKRDA